jgi:NifU-like protein
MSEPYIRRKIKELGLRTIPEITNAIKAGGACMSCHHTPGGLQDLLDEAWADESGNGHRTILQELAPLRTTPADGGGTATATAPTQKLSPYQFAKQVEKTIDEYIRPMLQRDGGDIQIVDIKDTLVYCQLSGACQGCANAGTTMKLMVEQTLKDRVDPSVRVIEV